jgi:hypothetical protein
MGKKCCSTTNLVVLCLGAALIVFFAGVTAAVAAGQTPPTALWAAGGALSGALVGLLVPAPASQARHKAAAKIAEEASRHDRVAEHEELAATTPDTTRTVRALGGIFVVMLVLSIVLGAGAIHPTSTFGADPLKEITKAVLALASAAGSALIGIYAPSTGKEG